LRAAVMQRRRCSADGGAWQLARCGGAGGRSSSGSRSMAVGRPGCSSAAAALIGPDLGLIWAWPGLARPAGPIWAWLGLI
jgi:hypothetical protein